MSFKMGIGRPKFADSAGGWSERVESMYNADHPGRPGRYNIYLHYMAFLTAGSVEYHWTDGAKTGGRTPFVSCGRAQDFLPDLHKKIRTFREHRYVHGFSSAELVRDSYDILKFLGDCVPGSELERFLRITRAYLTQNEDECFSAAGEDH